MIFVQLPNTTPYVYNSGNAGKFLGPSLPELPDPQDNDSCICDFLTCEYAEDVFASPPNPTEYWKNDMNEFLFKRFVPADTVDMELHLEGVKVADLNNNTYGTYFPSFTGSAEQQLYKGYLLDWLKVFNLHGAGSYTIVTNLVIVSVATTTTSRKFHLNLYSDILANSTVRIESTQNGNIFGGQFDFTGLNWYQSLRVPGIFGNPIPIYEATEYMTSTHKRRQNKAKMSREWTLNTKLISWEVVEKLIYNKLLGNEILITDYQIIAESLWRRVKVFMQEVEKPEVRGNPNRKYNIKFTDEKDIFTKRNF